jgi:predicted phage terminase large subunit-like protein
LTKPKPKLTEDYAVKASPVIGAFAAKKFKRFVKEFWHVLEPTNHFQDGWYVDAICDHLTHIFEIKRLLINIPPRHTKSLLCSVLFPAWLWLQDPSVKVLACSYALSLSKDLSLKCRRVIESPLYQHWYGDRFQLESDQNTQLKFQNTKTGYRQATSIESGNIGQGGDLIIFDDPNDIATINSKAEREKVVTFWRETLSTRANMVQGKTARLVIQQRAHTEDLSAYITEHDCGEWCKLILPFEYDKSKTVVSCLGWKDPRTKNGQPLSYRVPSDERDLYKREKGKAAWESQYNQNPRPDDGNYFKRANIRYFTEDHEGYNLEGRTVLKRDCWRYVSTDLAISLKTTADYSVFALFDVSPEGDLIVPRMTRDRLDASRLVAMFKSYNDTFKPAYFLVEQVGFQDFAIQQIRNEGISIRPVRPTTDKLTRSVPLQIKCENGQLWLPANAQWTGILEEELISFPSGKHDDQTDALAWGAQEAVRKTRKGKAEVEALPMDPVEREAEMARLYNEALLEGIR